MEEKYTIFHIEQHWACGYLIAMWQWDASRINVPNKYLPIPGVERDIVNQDMKIRIFKSNNVIILCQHGIVSAFYGICKTVPALQHIPIHTTFLTRGRQCTCINNTSLPIEVSDNANTIIAGINTADTDDIENPVHIVWKLLPSVLQYLVKI